MMRYISVLFLLFALTGCEKEQHEILNARPVVSEIVIQQAGLQSSYTGRVLAQTETDLGFPISGTLKTRPVQVGNVVPVGALLAQIDPENLDASVRAARAGVEVAKAYLNTAVEAASRVDQLVAKGIDTISKAQAAKATLVAAEATLIQAQTKLRQAEERREFAELTTTHEAVVTQVYAEPGAVLTAGQPVVRLASIGEKEVIIDLSEEDAAALVPGAEFRVRLLAAPTISTKALFRAFDPVVDSATRTRRLHLTLDMATPDDFRLGAVVQVDRVHGTQPQLTIPVSAILNKEPAAVWVISTEDRQAELVPVTLGSQYGDRVVVSSGLQDGQEVIVKGVNTIKDGQQIGPRVSK